MPPKMTKAELKKEMQEYNEDHPDSPIKGERVAQGARRSAAPRPEATLEMSAQEWRKFLSKWKLYKNVTKLHESDVVTELYYTMGLELQDKIYSILDPTEATEKQLMDAMETLATVGINHTVKRQEFVHIEQGEEETAAQFVARLRLAAKDCDWPTCPCPKCNGGC